MYYLFLIFVKSWRHCFGASSNFFDIGIPNINKRYSKIVPKNLISIPKIYNLKNEDIITISQFPAN